MISKKLFDVLRFWIPIAIASTLVIFLFYWAVQQDLRLSANDPQIQMSQDAASYLKSGGQITLAPGNKVELSKSLAPYIMLFDANKKLVTYSGVLHGKPAKLPTGVLDAAKKNGENTITWQPEVNVRSAIVVSYYKGTTKGYVLVGRSLKEVEKREDMVTKGVVVGWIITLFLTFISIWFINLVVNTPKYKK